MNKRFSNLWLFAKRNVDIVLITLIALGLRLRLIVKDDLWFDEAFTGNLMRADWHYFWQIVAKDAHPPLYYLLVKWWTFIFGVNDIALRGFSLLFGIFTVIVVYYLAKKLFNKETAALSAFLIAINPFMIEYSIEARSYSFYGFITLLAVFLIFSNKLKLALLAILALALTHYMSIAFIPLIGILFLIKLIGNFKKNTWRLDFIGLIAVAVVTAFVYFPVVTKTKGIDINSDWVRKANFTNIQRSIAAYSLGVKSRLPGSDVLNNVNFLLDENLISYGIFAFFILGVASVIIKTRKTHRTLANYLFCLGMTLIPMIMLISYVMIKDKSLYVERYLFPACIFFIICSAYALTSLLNIEIMGIIVFIYIFILTRIVSPEYYAGMKPLASYFRSQPNEVAFTSPIDYTVGLYYMDKSTIRLVNPKEPENSYEWWPFVDKAGKLENPKNAFFITPDPQRMTEDYVQPLQNLQFGNYQVWVKKN